LVAFAKLYVRWAKPAAISAFGARSLQGDDLLSQKSAIAFLCGVATLLAGYASGINARADESLPPPMPPVMRNVLMWEPGPDRHMVELKKAKSVNANVINVGAGPYWIGAWGGSLKPLAAFKMAMRGSWKADVDELNKSDIAVWTSFTTISFEPEVFKEYGLDPERYYARNEKGEPQQHFGGAYNKEGKVFSSCPNNPNWMALERDITLLFAENGFGGVFYDVGVLTDDAVMFCHCDYCKEKWKKHLADEGLDPNTPLPVPKTGRDMTQAVNRDHLRWRFACVDEDWMMVRNAVKAKYPKFVLGPNTGNRAEDMSAAFAIMGRGQVYDFLDFEEWGHAGAPYSAACGRAAGNGKPVVMIWNDGSHPFTAAQAKIALAEASATGEFSQNSRGAREYYDWLKPHEEYFADPTSMANVGIVYSQWSREFYEGPQKRHASWWFGQMLVDLHVPFEYLLAEYDLTPQILARYKALILPDVACLSNDQLNALTAYVKGGGAIYVTHELGKYDEDMRPRTTSAIETLTGHSTSKAFRAEFGKGRVAYNPGLPEQDYWEKNPRDPGKSKELSFPTPPPTNVTDALDWVFQKTLPVEIEAKSSTMVRLHRQKGRILVHLVNYNTYPDGKTITPDRNIVVHVNIPPESDAATVVAISPDTKEDRTLDSWKMENGKLSMTLDELESYTVLVVNLKATSPKKS
jgi:hypothetical protein